MKIATFLLACMAWIEFSISPPTPPVDLYTLALRATLLIKSRNFAASHRAGSAPEIRDGDIITIHKVINGSFAPFDVVQGHLQAIAIDDDSRTLGDPTENDNQRGEVEATLGYPGCLYHALMERIPTYEDHGHASQLQYLCTIERGPLMYLAAVLRPGARQPLVPYDVPRLLFANHHYRNPRDAFIGQLYPADPGQVSAMFVRLRAYERNQ